MPSPGCHYGNAITFGPLLCVGTLLERFMSIYLGLDIGYSNTIGVFGVMPR